MKLPPPPRRGSGLARRVAVLALALAATAALAHEIVWRFADGSTSRMTIDNGLIGTQYVDCTTGLCVPCEGCHTGRGATGYDAGRHQGSYFPRASQPLPPGQSMRVGDGISVSNEGAQLCMHNERRTWRRCYPADGTWLLKDAQGRPSLLWSLHPPRR